MVLLRKFYPFVLTSIVLIFVGLPASVCNEAAHLLCKWGAFMPFVRAMSIGVIPSSVTSVLALDDSPKALS